MLFFCNVQSFVLNLVIVALHHLTTGQVENASWSLISSPMSAIVPFLGALPQREGPRFPPCPARQGQDLHWTSDCPTQEPDKLSRWPREVTANKSRSQEDFLSYPYVDFQLASQAPTRVQHLKASTYDSWKRCADADAVGAQV